MFVPLLRLLEAALMLGLVVFLLAQVRPADAKMRPLGLTSDVEAAQIVLVRAGQPVATIVTAPQPASSVQLAVAELNFHLKAITGTALSVRSADERVIGDVVLVGASSLTRERGLSNEDFARQEFLVRTQPGALILMGSDAANHSPVDYENSGVWENFDWFETVGTLYAVYDFLEQCCGVRWYLPKDEWTVIPKRATLAFSALDRRRSPWTGYRWVGKWQKMPDSLYFWDFDDTQAVQRLQDDPAMDLPRRDVYLYWLRMKMGGDAFRANHSFNRWPERFFDSHPEYFGVDEDGKPQRAQMNYGSEAVVDQVVDDIKAHLVGERNYDRAVGNCFPVVPTDNRRWSQDAISQSLLRDEPSRTCGSFNNDIASKYFFQFVNRVAAKVRQFAPELTISTLAYASYFFPPDDMKFEPNVAVMVCKQHMKRRSADVDDIYYETIRQWREQADRVYIWEYYNFPQWRRQNVFPGIVPQRIGRDMAVLKTIPIQGEFIEINTAKGTPLNAWLTNPALQHMNYYFTMKLLDDPDYTIDMLLDDYYENFYGPAAEQMRTFFERIEATYLNPEYASHTESVAPSQLTAEASWTIYCPPERMILFERPIAKAKRLARAEPYLSRVRLIEQAVLQFMRTSSDRYHQQATSHAED